MRFVFRLFCHLVCAFFPSFVMAKELTVVNLRVDTELEIVVKTKSLAQNFKLKYGEDSGSFEVPDQGTTVSIVGEKEQLSLAKDDVALVVIFFNNGEKSDHFFISAAPREGERVARVLNLTKFDDLSIKVNGDDCVLKQKEVFHVEGKSRGGLSVQVASQKRKNWQPSEPSSVLAILCDEEDQVATHFITNH